MTHTRKKFSKRSRTAQSTRIIIGYIVHIVLIRRQKWVGTRELTTSTNVLYNILLYTSRCVYGIHFLALFSYTSLTHSAPFSISILIIIMVIYNGCVYLFLFSNRGNISLSLHTSRTHYFIQYTGLLHQQCIVEYGGTPMPPLTTYMCTLCVGTTRPAAVHHV